MNIYIKKHIPTIVSPLFSKICAKIFGAPIGAVTIFPFIVVRDEKILNDENYIRHESIHIIQSLETLIVGIYIVGLLQYLYAKFFLKMTNQQAYYFMSHEQEAHQNDRDIDYIKNRKFGSYYKYLLSKNKKKFVFENGERKMIS